MTRPIRLLVAALALLALAAGSVLAVAQPRPDEGRAPLAASPAASGEAPDGGADEQPADPLTAEAAQRIVDRLAAAGLTTDAPTLTALAAEHGVGGAVRLLGWAQDPEVGKSVEELAAMRDSGMGWGRIARELGTHPGIGRWMRGGQGPANAPNNRP